MNTLNAFVLAAGQGERMRPFTDTIPKPMLPVLGKPVLERVIERIAKSPVQRIGINLHHKAPVITEWVSSCQFADRLTLFHEAIILGTGGALNNASSFLSLSPFLVHNSDILTDIPLEKLIDHHLSSDSIATLAVHNHPDFNSLIISETGLLKKISAPHAMDKVTGRAVAFTGIAVYSPEFLRFIPGGASSVVDAWISAVNSGQSIQVIDFSGCFWHDIGTPSSFARAVHALLSEKGESFFVHPTVDCSTVSLSGFAVIEKDVKFAGTSHINNSIILPYSSIPNDFKANNQLIGQLSSIFIDINFISNNSINNHVNDWAFSCLREMNPVSGTEKKQFNLIGKGGSERRYFRISDGSGTGILLESPSSDPDFERYMQYSLFFHDNGIPVPDILSARCNPPVFIHDTQTGPFRYVLFEDLGDVPLYDFLKCHRSRTSIESIYKKIIDVLVLLHRKVSLHVSSCPLLSTRLFDYDHLRWETAYFLRSFVNDLLSISLSSKELLGLDLDFHMLANRVSKFKTTIVHRDFQSQNIMIDSASSPRLIDYQGARIGPPAYDVASLLWDPYYEIAGDIRDKLVDYYIDLSASTDVSFSAREFSSSLLPCRLQRHMQALGAYAFLALSKGKKYFTRFIPQAMAYLRQETEVTKDEYPQLHRLIERIREKA